MKSQNTKLITAVIASIVISFIVGLLSDIVASFFSQNLADQKSLVYVVTFAFVIILIPVSVYIALRPNHGSPPRSDRDPGSRARVTSNLPKARVFFGREDDKKTALRGLESESGCAFVVITGRAGIGKTALALEIGWLVKERREVSHDKSLPFEAIVWVEDHRGALTEDSLLEKIGLGLGHPRSEQIPMSVFRSEIGKRLNEQAVLIIVDGFETISDQVRDYILSIPKQSTKVLVTAMDQTPLPNKHGTCFVPLDKMSLEDQVALARNEARQLEPKLAGNDERMLEELCRKTEGDPYTIKQVVALKFGTRQPVDFDIAAGDDERLEQVWQTLLHNTKAPQALMAISVFRHPPTIEDVGFISEVSRLDLAAAIELLDRFYLVDIYDETDVPRYGLHSRTKAFASKKLASEQNLYHAFHERMAGWVEGYVEQHGGYRNFEGYPKLEEQYAAIMTAIKWCQQQPPGEDMRRALNIWRGIDHYMSVRSHWNDYIALGELVLDCAAKLQDELTEAVIRVEVLGFAYMRKDNSKPVTAEQAQDLEKAEALIQQGLKTFERCDNLAGISTAKRYLGMIAQQRDDFGAAQEYLDRSFEAFEKIVGRYNFEAIYSTRGIQALHSKNYEAAKQCHSMRLLFAQVLDNSEGMAVALYNLGRLAQIGKDFRQALDYFERAEKKSEESWKNDTIASSKWRQAECIFECRRDTRRAICLGKEATEIYKGMGREPPEKLVAFLDSLEAENGAKLSRLMQRLLLRIKREGK